MNSLVQIRGEGALLELGPHERSAGGAWPSCEVRFDAGGVSGRTVISYEKRDAETFREQLHRSLELLSGSASFAPVDEEFSCRIQMASGGRCRVQATFSLRERVNINLSLDFESDQSYLVETVAQLDEAMGAV